MCIKRWQPVLESLNYSSGFCSDNTILCQVSHLANRLCTNFVSHLYLELLFLPTGNSRNRSRVSNCAIPSTPALSSNIRERRCRFDCPFRFASRRFCRTQSMAPIIMSRSVIPAPTPIPVYAATDSSRGAWGIVPFALLVGCGEGIIVGKVVADGPVVLPGIRLLPRVGDQHQLSHLAAIDNILTCQ